MELHPKPLGSARYPQRHLKIPLVRNEAISFGDMRAGRCLILGIMKQKCFLVGWLSKISCWPIDGIR